MSEPDDALKFGLLMEGAQTHQRLAEAQLQTLRVHTQGLDGVVRDEIRRTLIEELQSMTAECEQAARALRAMSRAAQWRGLLWNITAVILCSAIPAAVAQIALPSQAGIAALVARRDSLSQNLARLEQHGGKVDWHLCGDHARLCVRIDRKAPGYGNEGDFYIVKGY